MVILTLTSIFLALIVTYVSYPFASIDRDEIPLSETVSGESVGEIIENGFTNPEDFELYDVYVYLSLSALLGILLDLSTPIIIGGFVGATYPIAKIKRTLTIRKAKKKIKGSKDLTVIAITGSYGKTTTKEIIYSLLKGKYNVEKTPENYNTDVGVASAIIKYLKRDTQVFLAEMGALRRSEIKNICNLLPLLAGLHLFLSSES